MVRITADGVIAPLPGPTSPNRDPEGWVMMPTPVNAAAYHAGYAGQLLTLTFDAVEPTDTSLYGNALEWWEEDGANAFTGARGNAIFFAKSRYYEDDLRPY